MWYLSAGLKPVGPFETLEIQDKIRKGHVSPYDLVFHQETEEWRPAAQWDELRRLGFPAFEAVGTDKIQDCIWIVLKLEPSTQAYKQEGPYTGIDIVKALREGHFSWEDLIWKKGLSGWARISDRSEFREAFANDLISPAL